MRFVNFTKETPRIAPENHSLNSISLCPIYRFTPNAPYAIWQDLNKPNLFFGKFIDFSGLGLPSLGTGPDLTLDKYGQDILGSPTSLFRMHDWS